MANFYGTVKGARGEASRCGNKKSRLETHCASWDGAVRCCAYFDEATQTDNIRIEFVKWKDHGNYRLIYDGKIDGSEWPYSGVVTKSNKIEVVNYD